MTKSLLIIVIFLSLLHQQMLAQTNPLRKNIQQLIASKKAFAGVSIYGLESGDTISINGNKHYPMQSVFKFHIALAVLNEIDKGKLSLHQPILIKQNDWLPRIWSPLRESHPGQDIRLPLDSILMYAVSQSDNNGCDILLKLLGGPAIVNNYMHSIGIKDISIKASEKQMLSGWNVQFSNWTTPLAATQLLTLFFNQKILSPASYSFLLKIMTETSTGPNRIKGQLPKGTIVAHKTGTSATNEQGITAAVNDIGIVTLPNGNHFIISVFVANSKENDETNEKIIADVSKLTWDYFVNKPK